VIELFEEDLGIIPGLLIVLCQLSLGMFCDRKMKLNLSFVAQWVLGMGLLALMNFFFLFLDMGFLIHLNILPLFLLRFPEIREKFREMKSMRLTLLGVGLLLLFSNVFNPVIDWDAQASYLSHARHWNQMQGLESSGLHHIFDLRSQAVSIIYTWGLMWGNDTSCQFLDLMFFLGFVLWLGQQFDLNSFKLSLMLLMSTAFGTLLLWKFAAVAGTDIIVYLFLVVLWEVLSLMKGQKVSWGLSIAWLILGIVFINIRWNCITSYAVLFLLFLTNGNSNKKYSLVFILVPLLGSGWYFWNFKVHGNPVYPHASDFFENVPNNIYLKNDFSTEGMKAWGVEGVRNVMDLLQYISRMGFVLLLYPLSLLVKIDKRHRGLFWMAWLIGFSSMVITVQEKFQCFSLMVLACLVITGGVANQRRVVVKCLVVAVFCVSALPFLGARLYAIYELVRDSRHGLEYLLDNRIRLYPAARWLNQQKEKDGLVLWPMNPHYYCKLPSLRVDNVAYQLPNVILNDLAKVSDYLINDMKVKWIVNAKPFYESTAHGAIEMKKHVDWIIEHDGRWQLVKEIEATGVSPKIEIYALKID